MSPYCLLTIVLACTCLLITMSYTKQSTLHCFICCHLQQRLHQLHGHRLAQAATPLLLASPLPRGHARIHTTRNISPNIATMNPVEMT